MFKRFFKSRPKKAKSYVGAASTPAYAMSHSGGGGSAESGFDLGPVSTPDFFFSQKLLPPVQTKIATLLCTVASSLDPSRFILSS